jgi:predicted Zn-dependent protease
MISTEKDAKEILERTLSFSSADEVRVNLFGGFNGHTRFALNSITTSGDVDNFSISVTSYFGKRRGVASGSELDDDSLRRIVKKSEELARYAPEDPEYVPELGPQTYLDIQAYFESTARATPELRADGVLSCVNPARKRGGLQAAGFFNHNDSFSCVGNNKGLFGYHRSTGASFTTTVRTEDGKGSGWASSSSRRIEEIDYAAVSRVAIDKAVLSRDAVELEPGKYPVILEAQAVADFLRPMLFQMSARSADEGRSFFSKKGGGNRIGERLFSKKVTIYSDPTHPDILGAPFDGQGFPAQKNVWVEKGVLKQLYYDRYWAQKQGKQPTGFPTNLVFEGSDASLEDLIRSADHTILVTRFWYIRFVDPQTILLTGLTRDGTFWIEKGEVKHAVKNFRFNESPVAFLKKVEMLSKPVRVGGTLVPAIKAKEFTFSSLSEAV